MRRSIFLMEKNDLIGGRSLLVFYVLFNTILEEIFARVHCSKEHCFRGRFMFVFIILLNTTLEILARVRCSYKHYMGGR